MRMKSLDNGILCLSHDIGPDASIGAMYDLVACSALAVFATTSTPTMVEKL